MTTTTPETSIDANDGFWVEQKIEAQNVQHLQNGSSGALSTTLSFYVKSSQTGTFGVSLYKSDNTARIINSTYTISSADTWEYKTITFAGDTAGGGIDNNNGEGLRVVWHLAAGSTYDSINSTSWADYGTQNWAGGHAQDGVITTTNATWQITGCQLEVGEQDTPFEHRSFADEMIRCQRYYQEVASGSCYFAGNGLGTTNIIVGIPLATSMRATPSVKQNGYTFHRSGNVNSSGANPSVSNFQYDIGRNAVGVRISGWASNNTDEVAYTVTPATEVLAFEAEL
jgi:hypothetical protein